MESTIDLEDASSALDLSNIRYQLIRLEDTIIFHLIERVQFPLSTSIYLPGAISIPDHDGSFLDYILSQQEILHARVRRYQSPDEYPFFPAALPKPLLAPLTYPVILHPNDVNVNSKIKDAYSEHILPACCPPSTDKGEKHSNYGSSAVADVAALQALSRRIHFGKFVAEAKYREDPERFQRMIRNEDREGLAEAITKKKVEEQVLRRLEVKARTYGRDPEEGEDGKSKINVEAVVKMYRDFVIPLTKEVEIEYLMQRLLPADEGRSE